MRAGMGDSIPEQKESLNRRASSGKDEVVAISLEASSRNSFVILSFFLVYSTINLLVLARHALHIHHILTREIDRDEER